MSKNEISIKKIFELIGILHKENAKLKECCNEPLSNQSIKPIALQLVKELREENAELKKCCPTLFESIFNKTGKPIQQLSLSGSEEGKSLEENASGTRKKSRRAKRRHRKKRTKHLRKKKRKTNTSCTLKQNTLTKRYVKNICLKNTF